MYIKNRRNSNKLKAFSFYQTSNEGVISKDQASISFYNDGRVHTAFGTSVQSRYQALITELTTLKFSVETSIEEEDGITMVVYNSTQNPKVFVFVDTMLITKDGLGSWTYYDFTVVRSL